MHRNSFFTKGAFFILISMLLFSACKPDKDNSNALHDADDNGGYATDASTIEWANNDVISLADIAGFYYSAGFMRSSRPAYAGDCATVGTDTNSIPHTLTIRFGTTDCQCYDGRKRRGTIVVTYNGRYSDSAAVHTISFSNYYVNGNQLSGIIQTIRVDTTVAGNWYYRVVVNDSMNMSQDPLNSQFILWRGNLVRKWVTGFATGDRNDDKFSVSGSAKLTRYNGHAYSFDISAPIQFATNCNYAESGVVNVTGYNGLRRLDYGSGGCDGDANVYIDVHSYPIKIN